MSSHREAPAISKDPAADNTDTYAFVDPVDTSKVTILANFIPFEEPAGGPNFFQFGDDVLYEIKIDNNGDGREDITYQFRFETVTTAPESFLYNIGPISSLTDPHWKVRQFYSVTKVMGHKGKGKPKVLGSNLISPPVRIGPFSTPGYATLADAAVHTLPTGEKVFAGQRGEGFYVDLGAIFDDATLRPLQNFHLVGLPPVAGKEETKGFNVHTIALQVPKTHLTRDGSDPDVLGPTDPRSIIGVYASASRQKVTVLPDENKKDEKKIHSGPFVQVSRLGNPLVNEVIIPLGKKDLWNRMDPEDDSQFLQHYLNPELMNLLPVLYPAPFPNLMALLATSPASRPRDDIKAILLTGLPSGVPPGFPGNFTGSTLADLLRLNMAILPSYAPGGINPPAADPKRLGLLGGDPDGFPNGRRVFDNVTAIELRVVAGKTYPLVAPTYIVDPAVDLLTDGTTNTAPYLPVFPYLALPWEGKEHIHD